MEVGGVWAPFKELYSIVNAAILRRDPEVYHNLDIQLKKHKPDFINLLKNPVGDHYLLLGHGFGCCHYGYYTS